MPGRYSVSVYGAINPEDGTLYSMLAEKFNTDTVKKFFTMLMEKINSPFYLVLDNSKPHRSKELKEWAEKIEDKIRLLFLPPYSPHLNKIERVWKLTRKTTTHNKYFAALEHLQQALTNQFKQWNKPNNTLKTLCEN